MSPRSLADIEADLRADRRDAADWLEAAEELLPPAETRETRVVSESEDGRRKERRVILFGGELLSIGEERGVIYDEKQRFVPMQGMEAAFDEASYITSLRIERALAALPEAQRTILEAHYLEGQTLMELRRADERRQSVWERVDWAKKAFVKQWELHKDDIIEPTTEEREELLRRSLTVRSVDELSTLPPQRCAHGPRIEQCAWCDGMEKESGVCSCY